MGDSPEVRGTGRTSKQLMDAPPDHFFVVRTIGMKNHTEMLAAKHAPEKKVRIIEARDVYRQTMSSSLPIVVDHDAREFMSEADWKYVTAHNSRYWIS